MPMISKVREVNVHYNDNHNRYEDMKLEFGPYENSLVLSNGGGKSVLLMMIFQTVIPNKSLTRRKVKEIFNGLTINTTAHSLIEWVLDGNGNKKRLLVGFCAKPVRIDETQKEHDIDYFTYAYLYDESNSVNNINELALSFQPNTSGRSSREVMSYGELKDKLKTIDSAQIFTTVKDLQSFLRTFNINAYEWQMMSRINEGEHGLEGYFSGKYTSKVFITQLIVPVINEYNHFKEMDGSNELVKRMISDKERFQKAKRDKAALDDYLSYIDSIKRVAQVADEAKAFYENRNQVTADLIFNIRKKAELQNDLKVTVDKLEESLEKKYNEERLLTQKLDQLNVQSLYLEVDEAHKKTDAKQLELGRAENKVLNSQKEYHMAMAINEYCDYMDTEALIQKEREEINKSLLSEPDLVEKRKDVGNRYKTVLTREYESLSEQNRKTKELKLSFDKHGSELVKEKGRLNKEEGSLDHQLIAVENSIKQWADTENSITQELQVKGVFNSFINDIAALLSEKQSLLKGVDLEYQELLDKAKKLDKQIQESAIDKAKYEGDLKTANAELEYAQEAWDAYQEELTHFNEMMLNYEVNDLPALKDRLSELKEQGEGHKQDVIYEINDSKNQLDMINEYGFYVFNVNLINLIKHLKGKFDSAILGLEYVKKNCSEEEQSELLERYPLLPYSVLLMHTDFQKIKDNINILGKEFVEKMIPILDLSAIQSRKELVSDSLLFPLKGLEFYRSSFNDVESYKQSLENAMEALGIKLNQLRESVEKEGAVIAKLSLFLSRFTLKAVDELNHQLFLAKEKKDALIARISNINSDLVQFTSESDTIKTSVDVVKDKIKEITLIVKQLEEIKDAQTELRKAENVKQTVLTNIETNKRLLRENSESLRDVKSNSDGASNELVQLENRINSVLVTLESLVEFMCIDGEISETPQQLKVDYEVYNERFKELKADSQKSEDLLKQYASSQRKSEDRIADFNTSIEQIKQLEHFSRTTKMHLDEMKNVLDDFKNEHENFKNDYEASKEKYTDIKSKCATKQEDYERDFGSYYPLDGFASMDLIKEEIKKSKNLKSGLSTEIREGKYTLKDTESKLETTRREYNNLEAFRIATHTEEESCDLSNAQERDYTFFKVEFERFDRVEKAIKKNFEKRIQVHLKDTESNAASAYNEELKKMPMFDGLSDVLNMVNGFDVYCRVIEDEIKITEKEIEIEAATKNEFIEMCYRTGSEMAEKLLKFNRTTKINIPGYPEKKSIIDLKLDVRTKEESLRNIGNHLNQLLDAEDVENKLIKNGLTDESLLSLVANLDTAEVRVYKFEEIKEASRYKKWEKICESSGQNLMIYLTVVAALLIFARGLDDDGYSTSTKVLLIDNPFGKAVNMYMWEPVVELLRANNIQLIAPAHSLDHKLRSLISVIYEFSPDRISIDKNRILIKEMYGKTDIALLNDVELKPLQTNMFE